jgi:sporulation protein YlmC with PRC-barrel domain
LALQSSKDKSLVEKKLRGSGGYAVAKVSDDEQKKANLGGPELFLAGIGRLEDNRFKKYYCNKCEKEYQGGPNIEFENPNEDLGENIILIEKGEYKCKTCDYVIAQYRKFNESNNEKDEEKDGNKNSQSAAGNNRMQGDVEEQVKAISKTEVVENNLDKSEENSVKQKEQASADTGAAASNTRATDSKSDYVQIEKIIGMLTYDHNAQLIGRVDEIGLRKTLDGRVEFSFKVKDLNNLISEISWNRISKIGDVIILSSDSVSSNISNNTNSNGSTNINISSDSKPQEKICRNCNHSNEAESVFCEECGKKLE